MTNQDTTGDTTIPSWAEHNLHQRIKAKEKAPNQDTTSINEQITVVTAKYFMATDPERLALADDIKALISDQVAKARKEERTLAIIYVHGTKNYEEYMNRLATLNGVKK